ncbi:hydroxyacid dehydrogenase [Streptomyces sp. NPDC014870]|uniref:hydroxyacid dehydrogenase n=1 Tax=Streptomyces sp. NPDC014870 TaxID=3364925 RepID=UPI0036FAD91D
MRPGLLPLLFPEDLMVRLNRCLDLGSPDAFHDLRGRRGRSALARAEVLVTSWGCTPLDDELLDAAPRLKAVIHAAGSVKHHLSEEAWRRGILVSSAADANIEPVVDFTIAMITLAGKRALPLAARYARGHLPALRDSPGNDGRVVGVVGASRIGRGVIARLRTSGFRVLVHDPYLTPEEARRLDAEPSDLDTLCACSDIVSLHAPDLPETRHLIDARRLSLMTDGAILINTARGSLVDTEALVQHCGSGRIDAVLDVTDPEPLPSGHPLFALPNVVITPHLAGVQGNEIRRFGSYATAEVERYTHGQRLLGSIEVTALPTLA